MPLLILIVGICLPRVLSVLLFFLTNWFNNVFQTWYWPLLGFVFTPYTMLWYSVDAHWLGGIWGVPQIIVLVVALVFDLYSLDMR